MSSTPSGTRDKPSAPTTMSTSAANTCKPTLGVGFTSAWRHRVYRNSSLSAPNSPAFRTSQARSTDPGGGNGCVDGSPGKIKNSHDEGFREDKVSQRFVQPSGFNHHHQSFVMCSHDSDSSFDDSMDIITVPNANGTTTDGPRSCRPLSLSTYSPRPNRPSLGTISPTPCRPHIHMSPILSLRGPTSPRRPNMDMSPILSGRVSSRNPRVISSGSLGPHLNSTCLPLDLHTYTSHPIHIDPIPTWRRNMLV